MPLLMQKGLDLNQLAAEGLILGRILGSGPINSDRSNGVNRSALGGQTDIVGDPTCSASDTASMPTPRLMIRMRDIQRVAKRSAAEILLRFTAFDLWQLKRRFSFGLHCRQNPPFHHGAPDLDVSDFHGIDG